MSTAEYMGHSAGHYDEHHDVSGVQIMGQKGGKPMYYTPPRPMAPRPSGVVPIFRQIAALPLTAIPTTAGDFPIQILPQRAFRLERLLLNDTNFGQASVLTVSAITVGADPQFLTTGNLPIQGFGATAFDLGLTGQTANPGIQLTTIITSPGGLVSPTTVSGGYFGSAVMPHNVPHETLYVHK